MWERFLRLENGDFSITLSPGETLFLKNFVKFKIEKGCCTLMGYTFQKSDSFHILQIPKWNAPEPLTAIKTNNSDESLNLIFNEYTSPFDTYTIRDSILDTTDPISDTEFKKIVPDIWHECADKLEKNGTIAFHGEKGAGKSTALLYFTNYFLNNCNKVAIIDIDVGQPLFTLPGIISLHILDKPVLKPGFALIHENFSFSKNFLIGDVSITNPRALLGYILKLESCLKEAIITFKMDNYKVLINTFGWTNDIGGQIFDCIVNIFKVNIILHISTKTDSTYKKQQLNFFTDSLIDRLEEVTPEVISANTYKIGNKKGPSPNPSYLRWLRVASYLNPGMGKSLEIHSFTHYEFFSGLNEFKLDSIVKNPSLFTPPVPHTLNISKLTFYLNTGLELKEYQLKNYFIAGCMAALFHYDGDNYEEIVESDFIFSFIHSLQDNELLLMIPETKSTINLDEIRKVVLCPSLGFDPQLPKFERPNNTSFVPFERNEQLHLTRHLGANNYSRRTVQKRPHEDEKLNAKPP